MEENMMRERVQPRAGGGGANRGQRALQYNQISRTIGRPLCGTGRSKLLTCSQVHNLGAIAIRRAAWQRRCIHPAALSSLRSSRSQVHDAR